MSILSSIVSVVEAEAEAIAPTIIGTVETAVASSSPLAAEAIAGLKTFLGTDIGQQVESWLGSLVSHVITPGAAVIVEPKSSATTAGIAS